VLSCSGQPHTTQVWRSIAPRIRAYFFRYGLVADLAQIAVEHGQLVEAMQTRDRDLVLEVVERHITVRTPGR
jgi:DNA-binding GntR family transcriptional regulator